MGYWNQSRSAEGLGGTGADGGFVFLCPSVAEKPLMVVVDVVPMCFPNRDV